MRTQTLRVEQATEEQRNYLRWLGTERVMFDADQPMSRKEASEKIDALTEARKRDRFPYYNNLSADLKSSQRTLLRLMGELLIDLSGKKGI
jgi:hypothetical protein